MSIVQVVLLKWIVHTQGDHKEVFLVDSDAAKFDQLNGT